MISSMTGYASASAETAGGSLALELKRRGIHNVVISDVPSVPFTEQVAVVEGGDEPAEEKTIVRKDMVTFTPPGSRKAVTCTVTAANAAKRICDLMDQSTKKAYRGVSWDDVEVVEE